MRVGPGGVAVVGGSVLVGALYLWVAVLAFQPQLRWPIAVSTATGRVDYIRIAAAAPGVAVGDHVLDAPRPDALRAYPLRNPFPGQTLHVATPHGVVMVTPVPIRRSRVDAIATGAGQITSVALVALAAFLCLRRPGIMAFSLWLSTLTAAKTGDLALALDQMHAPLLVFLGVYGFNSIAYAFTFIPFALRFPDGMLRPRERWAEVAAWAALGAATVAGGYLNWSFLVGRLSGSSTFVWIDDYLPAVPLVIALGVLIAHDVSSAPDVRAKTAWAILGFSLSIVVSFLGQFANAYAVLHFGSGAARAILVDHALLVVGNVAPMLAIYPILRFGLLDLGFVVNRATLYSALALAAVGTLAGVNWLAQHLVTQRFAIWLQPLAAIAIGLGFSRVRAWTRAVLERLFFRDRFAAEQHLAGMTRGFAVAERPMAIDDALTGETAGVLGLQSAAVFRLRDERLVRVAAVGWDDASLDELDTDDQLAQRLAADGTSVQLDALHWAPPGLPARPRAPAVAIALAAAGRITGIAFFGHHDNGTAIDPEELRLLRELCAAAATAHAIADLRGEVAALRAELAEREPV